MRKALSFLLILSCILFSSCSKSKNQKENFDYSKLKPVKIKFAHAIPNGELMNNIIEDWMMEVTKRSNNQITFDYYPAGILGTFVEIIEQVEIGAVNMSSGEPSLYEPWCPEISMLYAPLICDGYDHLGRCIYGEPGKIISQTMAEKNNTFILDWVYSGARVIASTKPLYNLKDMKGVIIRSPESQVYLDTFFLLGMSPTPMPMTEMYKAIQIGIVDACDCPAQAIYEGNYHKITGNVCKTRHMYALGTLSANENFWNSLSKEYKTLLLTVFSELKKDFNQSVQDSEDEYYQKIIADNVLVTEFEDREAFKVIAQPYWKAKAQSIGGNANKILDAINSLR